MLILISGSLFLLNWNNIYFYFAFEKMKEFYSDPSSYIKTDIEFLNDLENIIESDSLYEPALVNAAYYLISINDPISEETGYNYIQRLRKINPDEPLYYAMEFVFYEKMVSRYFTLGKEDCNTSLCKTSLDTLLDCARNLNSKFTDIYYIRFNVLDYLEFENFDEREKYLLKTIEILEDEGIRTNTIKSLDNFIEKYGFEGLFIHNVTYIDDYYVEDYIGKFYTLSHFKSYLQRYYGINFGLDGDIKPELEKFPEKYRDYLKYKFYKESET